METNKKVSIVIPVYKAADTITRCVESLEKNTYKNLQIILVEDCSGDQTINICKKLANTYDNVLCIENDQNHGVSYTRNQGLDYADGTYLMFVDSDDYVEADYVETMISVISCTGDENIMPELIFSYHPMNRKILKNQYRLCQNYMKTECYRLSGIRFFG